MLTLLPLIVSAFMCLVINIAFVTVAIYVIDCMLRSPYGFKVCVKVGCLLGSGITLILLPDMITKWYEIYSK